jgi:putative inorganic carbon (HCO3(-)) transporter
LKVLSAIAALAVVAAVCAVLVTQFMGAYAAMLFSGTGIYPENLYRGGFSNPRFLGQLHTMVLPLLVAACLHPGLPVRWRCVVAAVLVLSLVMGLLTASRATWYAWSVATVIVLAVSRPRTFAILGVQLAAIAAAGAVFYLMFVLPSFFIAGWDFDAAKASFGRLGQPMTLSMRDILWTRALELLAAHPLLGIGPMGGAVDMNLVATHPHNALLQIASEWGLPAAVLLCAAFALIGLRMARGLASAAPGGGALRESDPNLRAALAIALLGIAVHAAVDGVVVMPYTQMVLSALVGWSAAVLLPESEGRRFHPAWLALAAALAGAALVALVNGILPEVFLLVEREEDFAHAYSTAASAMPRLWAQGWLVEEVDLRAVRFLARPLGASSVPD